jgi:hypothetical protein
LPSPHQTSVSRLTSVREWLPPFGQVKTAPVEVAM